MNKFDNIQNLELMKEQKLLNIKTTIILITIALIIKIIANVLGALLINNFQQILPYYFIYIVASSLIIDIAIIIFIVKRFDFNIKKQINRVQLILIFLFCLLTILIFLLIIPVENPMAFAEKLSNNILTVHQLNFTIFTQPDFKNLLLLFLTVFIAPVVEEIIYRGIIMRLLLKKYSFIISLLLSSLLFAFCHLRLAGIGGLFLWGLLFGYAYYKTKSLVTPILIHAFTNLFVLITNTQFVELNSNILPKYILYFIICIAATVIVFSRLNKGGNNLKFETNIFNKNGKDNIPKS